VDEYQSRPDLTNLCVRTGRSSVLRVIRAAPPRAPRPLKLPSHGRSRVRLRHLLLQHTSRALHLN